MTDGAGLRQSHFGSGYDAGKARLQAEVSRLKAALAHHHIRFDYQPGETCAICQEPITEEAWRKGESA